MFVRTLTYFLILIFINSISHAEWTLVEHNKNGGNKWYVDFDSIEKKGKYTFYFELHDFGKKDEYGDMSAVNYKQVDCLKLGYKYLEDTYYSGPMASGNINAFYDEPDEEWTWFPKGTYGYEILKRVCSYAHTKTRD